jgi:hypothetical protein
LCTQFFLPKDNDAVLNLNNDSVKEITIHSKQLGIDAQGLIEKQAGQSFEIVPNLSS